MTERITSRDNPKIKYACKLGQSTAFRRTERSFLAEGLKLCPELARGCPIKVVFYTEKALERAPGIQTLGGEQYLIEEHVAQKLAGVDSHQGLFCIFGMPENGEKALHPGGRYLALERVQDPGNVGALVRSAAAFGFDAVIVDPGCASPFGPKALRASMGAAGRLPVVESRCLPDTLAQLHAWGVTNLAAALYNSRPLHQVDGAYPNGVCLVIGSEGQGLTEAAVAACDAAVRIPITDRVESLNASVAGSVLLWHFRRPEED